MARLRRGASGRGVGGALEVAPRTTARTQSSSRTPRSCTATSRSSPVPVPTSADQRRPRSRSRCPGSATGRTHRAARHSRRWRRAQARRDGVGRAGGRTNRAGLDQLAAALEPLGASHGRGPGHQGAAPQVRRHRAARRHGVGYPPFVDDATILEKFALRPGGVRLPRRAAGRARRANVHHRTTHPRDCSRRVGCGWSRSTFRVREARGLRHLPVGAVALMRAG